jgi:hypothetical protein
MQPIKIWHKQSALFGSRPEQQVSRVITSATHALMVKHGSGHWGRAFLAVMNAVVPAAATLKTISFKIRSKRRPWGSIMDIDIRLKW